MIVHFLIDGMLSGTGIRDALDGGYVRPDTLGLTASLMSDVVGWQKKYEQAHFAGFPDSTVTRLDTAGLALLSRVKAELPDKEIGYFSAGRMQRLG